MPHPANKFFSPMPVRLLVANGAVLAAASVALAAYASHAVDGEAQSRLQTAALFAFGHGVALAALGPHVAGWLGRIALFALYLGAVLFSGSLVFNVFAQWPTTLAPTGGLLMISGWLLWAVDSLRR